MSLLGMQLAFGRSVRARGADAVSFDDLGLSPAEREGVARVVASRGFRLTASIQRSWCEGRTIKGAMMTLSLVPKAERERLLGDWVDRGGGTNAFFFTEADAFLGYLAERLPDPSHALSVCGLERAVLRTAEAAGRFSPLAVDQMNAERVLKAGSLAALVTFYADPGLLLRAIQGEGAIPPLSTDPTTVLIAPGIEGFARPSERAEKALWSALARPVMIGELERQGHARRDIEDFLAIGAAEPV